MQSNLSSITSTPSITFFIKHLRASQTRFLVITNQQMRPESRRGIRSICSCTSSVLSPNNRLLINLDNGAIDYHRTPAKTQCKTIKTLRFERRFLQEKPDHQFNDEKNARSIPAKASGFQQMSLDRPSKYHSDGNCNHSLSDTEIILYPENQFSINVIKFAL